MVGTSDRLSFVMARPRITVWVNTAGIATLANHGQWLKSHRMAAASHLFASNSGFVDLNDKSFVQIKQVRCPPLISFNARLFILQVPVKFMLVLLPGNRSVCSQPCQCWSSVT